MVVSVPDPAINGNAIGTTLPLLGLLSGLKNSSPSTISRPRIKITILPATANDFISRPSKPRNCLPKNKNKIINAPEARVACVERICPPIFALSVIKIGVEPSISITANRVKVIVRICCRETLLNSNIYKIFANIACCGISFVPTQLFTAKRHCIPTLKFWGADGLKNRLPAAFKSLPRLNGLLKDFSAVA